MRALQGTFLLLLAAGCGPAEITSGSSKQPHVVEESQAEPKSAALPTLQTQPVDPTQLSSWDALSIDEACGIISLHKPAMPLDTELFDTDCEVNFRIQSNWTAQAIFAQCTDERYEQTIVSWVGTFRFKQTDESGNPCRTVGEIFAVPVEFRSERTSDDLVVTPVPLELYEEPD